MCPEDKAGEGQSERCKVAVIIGNDSSCPTVEACFSVFGF